LLPGVMRPSTLLALPLLLLLVLVVQRSPLPRTVVTGRQWTRCTARRTRTSGLAATISGEEGRGTLNPTALANEAWLKLAASPHLRWSSQLHFKRIAARAMRQVLVEAARRRAASKRGGAASLVTFDEAVADSTADARQLLAIDEALHDLARVSPRQAQMVESRFFGGMDIPETARLLQVSEATVQRDWRAARAWLARELAALKAVLQARSPAS
jgi:RNA polymerase sigma factor (TIGR02999 family)